jgi:ABC-2 type transport system ATP-binding protein
MTDIIIQTNNLTRYFGRKCAVANLSLSVPRGSVFGFLGRNGSGKTTTIRMLLGLLEPTRGSATVMDHDSRRLPPEVRARIGYLAESHPIYGWMRVAECNRFQSRFYSHWNHDIFHAVVEHFRLDPKAPAKTLSRGERAGLCLALTLAPEPELLILDDPVLGLDPVARRSLLESMIYLTGKEDRTILFSSHLLSDVERVADHIAILDRSVLRACCSLETFRQRVRQYLLDFAGTPPPVPAMGGLLQAFRTNNQIRVTLVDVTDQSQAAMRALNPLHIEEVPISLEDAFISYLSERGEKSFFLSPAQTPTTMETAA